MDEEVILPVVGGAPLLLLRKHNKLHKQTNKQTNKQASRDERQHNPCTPPHPLTELVAMICTLVCADSSMTCSMLR